MSRARNAKAIVFVDWKTAVIVSGASLLRRGAAERALKHVERLVADHLAQVYQPKT